MSISTFDQIREHVRLHYVEPARENRQTRFSVRCGNVQKELGMVNRPAHVFAALRSEKFLEPSGLRLVETSGPPSGTSTTVVYTYEFLDTVRTHSSVFENLLRMDGILKEVYKELGGAEHAIREERERYSR